MFSTTCDDNPPALENKFRYLDAKLNETGSSTSNSMESWSLPVSCWVSVEHPLPISPLIANLIFYLVVSIFMDSERPTYSLQTLENSPEGIVQIELKSVSGIPRF